MARSSMLGYVKLVLSKMTFDILLFEKELRKAIRTVLEEELEALRLWCQETFTESAFRKVVNRCFRFAVPA